MDRSTTDVGPKSGDADSGTFSSFGSKLAASAAVSGLSRRPAFAQQCGSDAEGLRQAELPQRRLPGAMEALEAVGKAFENEFCLTHALLSLFTHVGVGRWASGLSRTR